MNKAVIDLGTNTFHLLIYRYEGGAFETVMKKRHFVVLAEEGTHIIGQNAIKRGLVALTDFKTLMDAHGVQQLKVAGTSAFRRAENATAFKTQIEDLLKVEVAVLSGDDEANYIFKGNQLALEGIEDNYLIMDIGGGSCEFIIGNATDKLWAKSFPIGMMALHHHFADILTYTKRDELSIFNFLHERLNELHKALEQYTPTLFVGSAGTFDVVVDIKGKKLTESLSEILREDFLDFHTSVTYSTLRQRKENNSIPENRQLLMPLACILMQYVQLLFNPERFYVSHYAMKEGIAISD